MNILYKGSGGIALFDCLVDKELSVDDVNKGAKDFGHFSKLLRLQAFSIIKNNDSSSDAKATDAPAASTGHDIEAVLEFLERYLPEDYHESKDFRLGVADAKLGAVLTEKAGLACEQSAVVTAMLKGVDRFLTNFVADMKSEKDQLSKGNDRTIVKTIKLYDEMGKECNRISEQVREWYDVHFPELYALVPDAHKYCALVKLIQDRTQLSDVWLPAIMDIVGDEHVSHAIVEAAQHSTGEDISVRDLASIGDIADEVLQLVEHRAGMENYIVHKMHLLSPNLSAVAGEIAAARYLASVDNPIGRSAGSISFASFEDYYNHYVEETGVTDDADADADGADGADGSPAHSDDVDVDAPSDSVHMVIVSTSAGSSGSASGSGGRGGGGGSRPPPRSLPPPTSVAPPSSHTEATHASAAQTVT